MFKREKGYINVSMNKMKGIECFVSMSLKNENVKNNPKRVEVIEFFLKVLNHITKQNNSHFKVRNWFLDDIKEFKEGYSLSTKRKDGFRNTVKSCINSISVYDIGSELWAEWNELSSKHTVLIIPNQDWNNKGARTEQYMLDFINN